MLPQYTMKHFIICFSTFILFYVNVLAQERIANDSRTTVETALDFPEPIGYVSDFENLFSYKQIKELEQIIADFEANTTNQIAIASIESIGDYTDFDAYALDLSQYWGVGTAEKDNGMTIFFSDRLRTIRISTGYGTEQYLTNDECKEVIDKYIIPEFKNGNYYKGIKAGLLQLIKLWE